MTAAKGTWTGIATITYTYQWQLSADGGVTWTDIAGATATTYTPPAGTAGKQARVLVTGTNGDGYSQAASPASAVILPNPPVNTIAPTLTGTAQDGQRASASTSVPGPGSRPSPTPTNGSSPPTAASPGPTSPAQPQPPTPHPPAPPANKHASSSPAPTPTASRQAASPASAAILADPPVNTIAPSLTGTAQDGQPLGLNSRYLDRDRDHHLHLPVAALHRRRPHLDRHRRRNRNQLHATRRDRRQTSACSSPAPTGTARAKQPRRERGHPRRPPRQHRRAKHDRGHANRKHADELEWNVERHRTGHVRLPVAGVRRRRRDLDGRRGCDGLELPAARTVPRQAGSCRGHRDERRREQPSSIDGERSDRVAAGTSEPADAASGGSRRSAVVGARQRVRRSTGSARERHASTAPTAHEAEDQSKGAEKKTSHKPKPKPKRKPKKSRPHRSGWSLVWTSQATRATSVGARADAAARVVSPSLSTSRR